MDKDLVILKNEEIRIQDAQKVVNDLAKSNDNQQDRLSEMQKRIDAIYKKTGKAKPVEVPKTDTIKQEGKGECAELSYEELYEESRQSLIDRGLDIESIDFDSFLSETELAEIVDELDKPLPREEKWRKSDYIVVFVAALVGGITDAVLGNRKNELTGKGSKFSNWLNEIHEKKWKHKSGAPIDFQGKIPTQYGDISFGGGNHRELSRGHDLLRFVDGIKSFKNGTFEAVGFRDGMKISVSSVVNQNGSPYEKMALGAAIVEYCHHMLADLFSNNSLPFPGYSFLRESSNRDMRKFSADMYAAGFNLKNVIIQAASTISIEIIVRFYFSIQSVKRYKDAVDIKEDYSNWEVVKKFVRPANKDKLHEMLLVAHTIVTAINIGKITITKQIQEINVTEITSVINYGIKVLKAVAKRNEEYAKIIYHSTEVQNTWEQIGNEVGLTDEILISAMDEELVIA